MYMSSKLGHIKSLNLHPSKPIPLVVSYCLYIGLRMHGFLATTPFSHFFFQGFRFFLCFSIICPWGLGLMTKVPIKWKNNRFNVCKLILYFYVTDIQIGVMNKQSNFWLIWWQKFAFKNKITLICICPNTIFKLINIFKYTTMYQMCIRNDMRFQAELKTCYMHMKFDPR